MAEDMAWFNRMTAGRAKRLQRFEARLVMFTDKVLQKANITVKARIMLAGQIVRDKVVINISQPVRKFKDRVKVSDPTGAIKYRTVTRVDPESRSKAGEFPRADTTRLMKDVFFHYDDQEVAAIIGITLGYGLILETKMDRSFLRRTFLELHQQILLILTGGPSGGGAVQFTVSE